MAQQPSWVAVESIHQSLAVGRHQTFLPFNTINFVYPLISSGKPYSINFIAVPEAQQKQMDHISTYANIGLLIVFDVLLTVCMVSMSICISFIWLIL